MMRRILVLVTVAAMMALGVAGQAWADPPNSNSHNCAGEISSEFAPEGTSEGAWADNIRPFAHNQQADEESRATAQHGNCGDNNVPD
jgi:predicted lipoprotein